MKSGKQFVQKKERGILKSDNVIYIECPHCDERYEYRITSPKIDETALMSCHGCREYMVTQIKLEFHWKTRAVEK